MLDVTWCDVLAGFLSRACPPPRPRPLCSSFLLSCRLPRTRSRRLSEWWRWTSCLARASTRSAACWTPRRTPGSSPARARGTATRGRTSHRLVLVSSVQQPCRLFAPAPPCLVSCHALSWGACVLACLLACLLAYSLHPAFVVCRSSVACCRLQGRLNTVAHLKENQALRETLQAQVSLEYKRRVQQLHEPRSAFDAGSRVY